MQLLDYKHRLSFISANKNNNLKIIAPKVFRIQPNSTSYYEDIYFGEK